jgi:membrane protein YdbS with pleckstrin-like domain
MELEQDIERLKERVATLERAQWQTRRHVGAGLAVLVAVGLFAVPPHTIRWVVAVAAAVVALRFWPSIMEAIPWQSRKEQGSQPNHDPTTC